MRMLLALLQAAATSTNPAPAPPERIDLLALASRPCSSDGAEEDVVVCARRRTDRLGPLPDKPGPPDLPPMTVRLPGGGTANLHAVDTSLPGAKGNAAVVTLKIPF